MISPRKLVVWSEQFDKDDTDSLQQGVKRLVSPGTVLLGAPISTVQFEAEILEARVTKVELMGKLSTLKDPHRVVSFKAVSPFSHYPMLSGQWTPFNISPFLRGLMQESAHNNNPGEDANSFRGGWG